MNSFRQLREAVKELYKAGTWSCPTLSLEEQKRLWENIRDKAKISKGTATSLGVGSPEQE